MTVQLTHNFALINLGKLKNIEENLNFVEGSVLTGRSLIGYSTIKLHSPQPNPKKYVKQNGQFIDRARRLNLIRVFFGGRETNEVKRVWNRQGIKYPLVITWGCIGNYSVRPELV